LLAVGALALGSSCARDNPPIPEPQIMIIVDSDTWYGTIETLQMTSQKMGHGAREGINEALTDESSKLYIDESFKLKNRLREESTNTTNYLFRRT
jgi:hypothetical protein